jgi:hypothetical protein
MGESKPFSKRNGVQYHLTISKHTREIYLNDIIISYYQLDKQSLYLHSLFFWLIRMYHSCNYDTSTITLHIMFFIDAINDLDNC